MGVFRINGDPDKLYDLENEDFDRGSFAPISVGVDLDKESGLEYKDSFDCDQEDLSNDDIFKYTFNTKVQGERFNGYNSKPVIKLIDGKFLEFYKNNERYDSIIKQITALALENALQSDKINDNSEDILNIKGTVNPDIFMVYISPEDWILSEENVNGEGVSTWYTFIQLDITNSFKYSRIIYIDPITTVDRDIINKHRIATECEYISDDTDLTKKVIRIYWYALTKYTGESVDNSDISLQLTLKI